MAAGAHGSQIKSYRCFGSLPIEARSMSLIDGCRPLIDSHQSLMRWYVCVSATCVALPHVRHGQPNACSDKTGSNVQNKPGGTLPQRGLYRDNAYDTSHAVVCVCQCPRFVSFSLTHRAHGHTAGGRCNDRACIHTARTHRVTSTQHPHATCSGHTRGGGT